jgi:hypothetical protein
MLLWCIASVALIPYDYDYCAINAVAILYIPGPMMLYTTRALLLLMNLLSYSHLPLAAACCSTDAVASALQGPCAALFSSAAASVCPLASATCAAVRPALFTACMSTPALISKHSTGAG